MNETHYPYREHNPPLTSDQESVTLGRGDRALEPTTPEEWNLHAIESMNGIAEVVQSKHGEYRGDGYRPIDVSLPGVNILYVDAGGSYEVRVQPPVPGPVISPHATREEILALTGYEGRQERQAVVPEYKWISDQAHLINVQQYGQERQLHALPPEEVEAHAQYLRGIAIYVAGDEKNEQVLAKLIPPEAHE